MSQFKRSEDIKIAVSARHVHLTQDVVDVLFGKGFELHADKPVKGQFCSTSRVSVVCPKFTFDRVAVMGPCRDFNQFEFSITDAIKAGIEPMVRMSGDIKDTPGCIIRGPEGEVEIKEGVIVAKRHIHLNPLIAAEMGVKDGDSVMLEVDSDQRKLIFDDTIIRMNKSDKAPSVVHIDTDEGNAAQLARAGVGRILQIL